MARSAPCRPGVGTRPTSPRSCSLELKPSSKTGQFFSKSTSDTRWGNGLNRRQRWRALVDNGRTEWRQRCKLCLPMVRLLDVEMAVVVVWIVYRWIVVSFTNGLLSNLLVHIAGILESPLQATCCSSCIYQLFSACVIRSNDHCCIDRSRCPLFSLSCLLSPAWSIFPFDNEIDDLLSTLCYCVPFFDWFFVFFSFLFLAPFGSMQIH